MSASLDEILRLAGITSIDQLRRRKPEPPQGLRGELGDPVRPSTQSTMMGDAPVPVVRPLPPPRSLPSIVPEIPAPGQPKTEMEALGEPPEPPPAPIPRDYVSENIAKIRELEEKKSPAWSNILTGITHGIAALEGNQPKQPWEFAGRTRSLNDAYGRLERELGVQKEQAQIKNLNALGSYRNQQQFGSQQKRMIDLYKALPKYTRGERPEIDAMFEAAGLEFENKDPKTSKPGRPYRFKHLGQVWEQYPGEEARPIYGEGGAELIDRSQIPIEAQGAISGQTYSVKPGAALGAEATTASQAATQGRFESSEQRQTQQFQTQEFHRRQTEARTAAENWQKAYEESQSLKAAVDALEQKRQQQGGTLYGQDAINMATWPKLADAANMRATSLMNEINTRHGDFYYIDQSGLTAKNPPPPTVQPSAPTATTAPSTRPKVDHAKFEKMYAEAKTPEERARLMKLYQDALKIAGQ